VAGPRRATLVLLALAVAAALALGIALGLGSVATPPGAVLDALLGRGDPLSSALIVELRLPRALAAFAVGGLLALAGVLMQVLLRNPLADPYVLGVSGGAAVGALASLALGLGAVATHGNAFLGALASTLLVFALAHARGGWTPTRLLLTGVVVASGWAALIGFGLALAPDGRLRSMLFWLMGDLGYAEHPGAALAVLALALGAALPFARELNVLARGAPEARALGVAVEPLTLAIYALASLATAVAVTQGGSIGFVGLVVPHLLRLWQGADHRILLPGAVLAGGALLTAADALARTVAAPLMLPVGVVTAAIGVPLFLYLLNRTRSPV
jgi:iron complex transport system permease protein